MAFVVVIFTFAMRFMVSLGAMKHLMRCKVLWMLMVEECFVFCMPTGIIITMNYAGWTDRSAGLTGYHFFPCSPRLLLKSTP